MSSLRIVFSLCAISNADSIKEQLGYRKYQMYVQEAMQPM
jgi:hypothetical protein